MTTPPRLVPVGSSAQIKERQDQPQHLQRLLAYSHLYRTAQRWRRVRAFGTFVLATVGPIVALLVPPSSDIVAAVAATWLVAGRTVLSWLEEHDIGRAVGVQELYDTRLFKLPWNTALAGREPAPEDVAAAAAHIRDDTRYRDWYCIDLREVPWPGDVLLCQRMSMIWSRRDHRAYGTAVLITGIGWFLLGLVVALVRDLSLAAYLIKIFLPSSPALLDCAELARAHWRHATRREQAEHKIRDLWDANQTDPAGIEPTGCREIQDTAYLLRRDGPRVPEYFYRLRQQSTIAALSSGAAALVSGPGRYG
jgi:hypothetical protein